MQADVTPRDHFSLHHQSSPTYLQKVLAIACAQSNGVRRFGSQCQEHHYLSPWQTASTNDMSYFRRPVFRRIVCLATLAIFDAIQIIWTWRANPSFLFSPHLKFSCIFLIFESVLLFLATLVEKHSFFPFHVEISLEKLACHVSLRTSRTKSLVTWTLLPTLSTGQKGRCFMTIFSIVYKGRPERFWLLWSVKTISKSLRKLLFAISTGFVNREGTKSSIDFRILEICFLLLHPHLISAWNAARFDHFFRTYAGGLD